MLCTFSVLPALVYAGKPVPGGRGCYRASGGAYQGSLALRATTTTHVRNWNRSTHFPQKVSKNWYVCIVRESILDSLYWYDSYFTVIFLIIGGYNNSLSPSSCKPHTPCTFNHGPFRDKNTSRSSALAATRPITSIRTSTTSSTITTSPSAHQISNQGLRNADCTEWAR